MNDEFCDDIQEFWMDKCCIKPETSCALNGKNGKECGKQCCAKQDKYGMTCHWDGSMCAEGEAPTDAPSLYADCVMEDTMWKKGQVVKKKADDPVECFEKCASSK